MFIDVQIGSVLYQHNVLAIIIGRWQDQWVIWCRFNNDPDTGVFTKQGIIRLQHALEIEACEAISL